MRRSAINKSDEVLGVFSKNLRGKGGGQYYSKKYGNDLLKSLHEILYDDEISQAEAIYIREMFKELQVQGWKDLEEILHRYGQPEDVPIVEYKPTASPAKRRNLIFLSIVGPTIMTCVAKLLI